MPVVYPLAICYLLGLVAASRWSWNPAVSACCAIAGAAMLLSAQGRRGRAFLAGLCLAGFFCAVLAFHIDARIYEAIPMRRHIEQSQAAGRRLCAVRGVARTAPLVQDGRARFDLHAQSVRSSSGEWNPMPGRLRVVMPEGAPAPRVGDILQLEGSLSNLERLDPDVAAGLRRRHVAGFLFPHPAAPRERLGDAPVFFLFRLGETLRMRIGAVYTTRLGEPYAAVMGRMAFGQAWRTPRELYDAFRRAGTVHVLVVSGLHVSVLLGAFLWIAFLWKNNPWISLAVLAPGLLVFFAMTGGGPSVTRAVIMGLVFLAALAAGREYHALPSLCWAGLFMMCADPHAPFQAGAQMSFLACLGIMLGYPRLAPLIPSGWPRAARWVARTLLVSLCAQIPLYPVVAWYFHKVSLVSIVSNVAAVPLAMAALVSGFALGVLGALWGGFAVVLAPVVKGLLWLLIGAVRIFAAMPFSDIVTARPSYLEIALYAAGACGAVMAADAWLKGRGRALTGWMLCACVGSVALAWSFAFRTPPKHARVTFFEVGQGDSALIEAPCGRGRAPVRVLVDGGGGPGEDAGPDAFDPGERVIAQALFRRGIARLDAVIATHPEEDHLDGLLWSLEHLRVGRMVDLGFDPGSAGYDRMRRAVASRRIPYTLAREGLVLRAGGCLLLEFLHPPREFLALAERNPNEVSTVFKMRFADKSVLFTGDIEDWAEEMLVQKAGNALRSDALKIPHHGSATSSSAALLDAVSPGLAVISAGRGNMYGHPHPAVIERLERRGVRVLRTNRHGDIELLLPRRGPVRTRTQFSGE